MSERQTEGQGLRARTGKLHVELVKLQEWVCTKG